MLKVILVDDEDWCLKELFGILIKVDVEVIGAYSYAHEALADVDSDRPDIAFIDVLMPGMNGLDLAKKLKIRQPDMKVVLMSEKEDYARHAFDIGVDDYILKPVREERVRQTLVRASQINQMMGVML